MSNSTQLVLFFTWDVSLDIWKKKGLLQREVKLYKSLAQKGVDVTFLSWGGSEDQEIAKALLPDIKTVSVYNHIFRPNNKVLRCVMSLFAPWALREVIRTADVLKTNQIWGGWVAVLSKIMFKKPLVVRCGFELHDFTVRQGHNRLRRAFVWLISRVTYGFADHICVAAGDDRNYVVKNFKQKYDKISIHPNWINTDFFVPYDCEKKENSILFVGRLSKQKNLFSLIDAMHETDIVLDIVGDGELRCELEDYVSRKGLAVNFLGSYPNDKLPLIYNSYPVFVLPSYYEGNPKALLEAMSCGCAVVGTDVHGISSVVEHNVNGLLCSLEKDSIRRAVVTLMNDGALRGRLGTRARKQIVEHQTLDKLLDKEITCYDLLKGKS